MKAGRLRNVACALAIASATMGVGEQAHAQKPEPVLVRPALVRDPGATYPKQAVEDMVRTTFRVELRLDLDAKGAVTNVVVTKTSGREYFDVAATTAARGLLFRPATRDGRAIPSRIPYAYDFAPLRSVLSGRVFDAETGAPLRAAQVSIRDEEGKTLGVESGPDGRWSIESVLAGKYSVSVTAAGYVTSQGAETVRPGEAVQVLNRLAKVPSLPIPQDPRTSTSTPPTILAPIFEEISVRGVRPPREVTRRTLEQRELARIPGTSGDAIRAIENLPGVARPPGLAGLLIIRGSAPQDTQVFADGTYIPLIYHFGGLRSVIPTEMLEKVDFYPGNYSAQFGRAMGGIVDAGLRNPNSNKYAGVAQVDLIDARVFAEGPIGKGWSFAVGARRSYLDAWLGPVLEKAGAGVTTAPVYYDYQAMITKEFSKKSSLRFLFFGSDDRLEVLLKKVGSTGLAAGAGGDATFHTAFWRAQALYKTTLGEDTPMRVVASVGQDRVAFSFGDIFLDVDSYPVQLRAEVSPKLGRSARLNLGMDFRWVPYEVTARFPPAPRPGEPAGAPFFTRPPIQYSETGASYLPALYTELELTPWRGGRIVPGVRLDYTKATSTWDFQPRINVRQDIVHEFPKTTLKAGFGVFAQPPLPQDTNPAFGQLGLRNSRSVHYTLGAEQEITQHIDVSLEGFYKDLSYLITRGHGNDGTGRSYGLEALVRYKPDAAFFGWIAYTLSRSERRDTSEDPLRLFQYDQTHILSMLGSYKFGRGWELGARFRLVSGSMYTPNQYGFYDQTSGAYLPLATYPPFSSRLPVFHQLDLRLEKMWTFTHWKFSTYLDVLNVYNNANVEGLSYSYNFAQRAYGSSIPFLPNLGLRGEL